MANIAALLKSEISRLSKKVVKEHVQPIRAASAGHRRQIASLKQQVEALNKEVARLNRSSILRTKPVESITDSSNVRFQARGLRSLRSRLGFSAEDFGRLVGVTAQSIYNWETEKATPRRAQIQSLAKLRAIGKREAKSLLDQMG